MKKMILSFVLLVTISPAWAKKDCTDQPKDKWMTEEAFKAKVEKDGYTIKKFKKSGNCYEIYGKNKEGKSVEIYFSPVDASIKKSEVEDD